MKRTRYILCFEVAMQKKTLVHLELGEGGKSRFWAVPVPGHTMAYACKLIAKDNKAR